MSGKTKQTIMARLEAPSGSRVSRLTPLLLLSTMVAIVAILVLLVTSCGKGETVTVYFSPT